MRAPRLLVGKVGRRAARPLAFDEHPNHALAVVGPVLAAVDRQEAPVPSVDESVRRLAHRGGAVTPPSPRRRKACCSAGPPTADLLGRGPIRLGPPPGAQT